MGNQCCQDQRNTSFATVVEQPPVLGATVGKPAMAPNTDFEKETASQNVAPAAAPAAEIKSKTEESLSTSIPSTGTSEFTITLKRDDVSEKLGVSLLKSSDGHLIFKDTSGSRLEEWHLENPDKQVRGGDQIIKVNGVTGDAEALLNAVATQKNVDMVLSRLTRFTVEIVKRGALGMKLESETMKIKNIAKDGVIYNHNNSLETQPSHEVRIGDFLIQIDEITKGGPEFATELTKLLEGEKYKFVFGRPAVEEEQ